MPKHESYRSRVHDSSTPYFTREREDESLHRATRRDEAARRPLHELLDDDDEEWSGLFDSHR